MVKFISLLVCFQVLLSLYSFSGDIRYPVSSIDTALLRNASMVVRLRETIFEVKSFDSEVLKTHYVLTILKGSASGNAIFTAFYNKYSSVTVFKGSMYDASGKLIRNFNSKDISDESAIDDGVLYSDNRVKFIRPVLGFYPVTVEFFSEVTIKQILRYPSFVPQDDYGQAVENCSLEIIAQEEFFPRFKEVRLPANVIVTRNGTTDKKWEFGGIKPKIREPLSPSLEELVPIIYLNPAFYNFKDYLGDFLTWQSYGMWVNRLNEGRDSLAPVKAKKVRDLVQEISDPREKVKIIYNHMQQNTRYVAVELGIGGWQPETAEMVAQLGYGDCKGLVNYTSAMLKCVGISSFAVLVNAGKDAEPIQRESPGNRFNHVILCVPVSADTIWLECTSQRQPFGFLGSFTHDRDALLLCHDGGKIVHTPVYGKKDNAVQRKTTITIDSTGSASVVMNTCYRGLMFEAVQELLYLSPEKQIEELVDRYSIPGLKIVMYSCKQEMDKLPSVTETLVMKISNYASLNGSRLFIPPNTLVDREKSYSSEESRTSDLVLRNCYTLSDSVLVELPKEYRIESRPASFECKSDFGELKTEVQELDSKVLFIRHFERENGRYPPFAFNDFVAFIKKVSRQDDKKLVIVKK